MADATQQHQRPQRRTACVGHENPRRAHQRCGGPNPRPFVCLATGRIVPERGLLGVVRRREKSDEHYVAAHFGTDPEEVTLLNPLGALAGDASEFTSACNSLLAASPSSPALQRLCGDVRCGELHGLLHPPDFFPKHGLDGHRLGAEQHQGVQGLPAHTWRYILYDTDACLGHFGQSVWENYLEYARNPSSPSVHSNLFDHVLDNPTFRHRFVNRYADLVNTLLQSEAFIARMGAMTAKLKEPCPSTSRAGDLLRGWTHGTTP